MNLLHHTIFGFMVYKDYKISLKFVFPIRRINFRIQHHACPFIDHHITIHHNIFLNSLPCKFSYRIIHWLLIILMLINNLLLSKFIQACHAKGGIRTKIISLYIVMVYLMASSGSSLVFIQFRRGIFNFFASSNRDVLLIYL